MTFIVQFERADPVQISGLEDIDELCSKLIANWIPYVECHQCGMVLNCSYAHQPHPETGKRREIKCGMASQILRNWMRAMRAKYIAADEAGKRDILQAAFYFSKIGYLVPWSYGSCLSEEYMGSFGAHAPGLFRSIVDLRTNLDALASSVGKVDIGLQKVGIHFVEGETEFVFLDTWFRRHGHFDEKLSVYGGRGNRRVQRMELALKDYHARGYDVYISGDADGLPGGNPFQQLVDRQLVKPGNVFYFQKDFESAFPLPVFQEALKHLGLNRQMDGGQELQYGSRVRYLKEGLGIDIDSVKVDLAEILSRMVDADWNAFLDSGGVYANSEISNFVKFSVFMP